MPDIGFAFGDFPNFYELMAELRAAGPVVPVKFIGERAWLICGYPELQSALADEVHFTMAAAYRELEDAIAAKAEVARHHMEDLRREIRALTAGLDKLKPVPVRA